MCAVTGVFARPGSKTVEEAFPAWRSSPAWHEGVRCFDEARYWEAHEALEPLWLKAQGDHKHFLSGIILLAAALHKARSLKHPVGARRNYAKALKHLAGLQDRYLGLDLRGLERRTLDALQDLTCPFTLLP